MRFSLCNLCISRSICVDSVSIRCCRCLLGNESEKYVIENLYDFDLGIITITIDERANEESGCASRRDAETSEPAIFDIFVKNIVHFCRCVGFVIFLYRVRSLFFAHSNARFIPFVHPFDIFLVRSNFELAVCFHFASARSVFEIYFYRN